MPCCRVGTPGTALPVPRQGRGPAPSSSCPAWALPPAPPYPWAAGPPPHGGWAAAPSPTAPAPTTPAPRQALRSPAPGQPAAGGLRVGQAVDVIGVVLADAGRERLLSDLLVLVGHAVLPAPELELQPVPEPQFPGPLLHQMIPLVLVRRQAPEGKPEGQPGKELFLGVGLVQPPQEIVLVRRAELLCLPPVPHCFLHFVHGNTSFFCYYTALFCYPKCNTFWLYRQRVCFGDFFARKNEKKEGENKKSPRSPERRAGNLSFTLRAGHHFLPAGKREY